MPVAIDSANVVATSAHVLANTAVTMNCTCAAADNCLAILVGADQQVTPAPPSVLTYNGVGLTLLSSISKSNNYLGNASIWYLFNPPTGSSLVVSAQTANNQSGFAMCAIPMSGVDTGRVPIAGTGANGTSAAAACSVSGATSNDLQLGVVFVRSTTLASAGAPQNVVTSTPTLPLLSINGLDSFSADYITAGSAGNFAWTLTSNDWAAIAATFFAPYVVGICWVRA